MDVVLKKLTIYKTHKTKNKEKHSGKAEITYKY